jgi:tRNA modification GTPase
MTVSDTITAIATPPGVGGVAVIRVSGPQALALALQITSLKTISANQIKPATIFSYKTKQRLDHGLVAYFAGPHSYTGEDTIEINCHGSRYIAQRIIEECLQAGARLAKPGEFTRRAFLAGKIDLSQAEAVAEMLVAQTDLTAHLALNHLEGDIAKAVRGIRQKLLGFLSAIEASLDYPEEIEEPKFNNELLVIHQEVQQLLKDSATALTAVKGISIALVGKTNVGKSSLFNALAKMNRAIVTDVHGTTRDYLEQEILMQGVRVTIVDTAGIRDSVDQVEQIGIARSKEFLTAADLVVCLLDASTGITDEDKKILETIKAKKNVLYVLNKIDVAPKAAYPNAILVSASNGNGLVALEQAILQKMEIQQLDVNKTVYITSWRQREALVRAEQKLAKILSTKIDFIDMIAVELKDIIIACGEITGESVSEEIINHIFDHFCVGK